MFSCKFWEVFYNAFLQNTSGWLLLTRSVKVSYLPWLNSFKVINKDIRKELLISFCWIFYDQFLTRCSLLEFIPKCRSSRPEVFLVQGVLKICRKSTGEDPCRSAISIKLQRNLIEIARWHECSPANLLHIFRTPFPKNTSDILFTLLLIRFYQVESIKSITYLTVSKMPWVE